MEGLESELERAFWPASLPIRPAGSVPSARRCPVQQRAAAATGAMRADRAGRRSRPAAMHRHVPAGAGHDACRPGTASRWASSRSPA
ncbi:hypothetical protein G6F68_017727 [Rhizopus microsporus]|nr:hypothetical protein G6F68_017727 [Rhizopus microsporus]